MTKTTSAIDFTEGFNKAVAANQKVWAHDRSTTVGASEVFSCIRQNVFKKRFPELATPSDEVNPEWGHAERGNLIENEFVVPTLRHMFGEDRCLFMGEEQKTFVDGRLSATPDGVVTDQATDALANYGIEDIGPTGVITTEVKSFGGEFAAPKKIKLHDEKNPKVVYTRYEAKPKHVGQAVVQMGILRRKTNYQPDYGVVLYVNPVNLKDIRPSVVKYNDTMYLRAKKRAEEVFDESRELKDYAAEGKISGNDCTYCDFCEACNQVEMARLPSSVRPKESFSPEEESTLALLVRDVASKRAAEKELVESKKLAEAKLKDYLFDMDTTRYAGEGWSVSISKNNGRKSIDKDKIVEDFDIDLDDYMKEGQPFFVMRVKYED